MNSRSAATAGATDRRRGARWMLLGALLLVLAQAGVGMAVNLDVTIPGRHPGSSPSDYFAGSFHSVAWALAHGSPALSVHVVLGLALGVFAVGAAVHGVRTRSRPVAAWTVLGGLLVIGAGFNGASFLDFNGGTSSLIMALLALGAAASYGVALFALDSVRFAAGQPSDPG